jgi:hypothetical protein
MSYELYDKNGSVGYLGTTYGLDALYNYLGKQKVDVIDLFIDDGWSADLGDLVKALSEVPKSDDPNLQDMIDNLIVMLKSCDEVAIITDGFESSKNKKSLGLSGIF